MFIIVMLCNDLGRFYIDYINESFDDFEKAQDRMYKCVNEELESLKECGEEFEVANLNKEVVIYDENKEPITQYEIININK